MMRFCKHYLRGSGATIRRTFKSDSSQKSRVTWGCAKRLVPNTIERD